jgi:hypothetical protein
MMTRKDYRLVVDAMLAIRHSLERHIDGGPIMNDLDVFITGLAADFEQDNPKFDWEKFLKACEVEG